jgi:hypothetical protein
MENTSLLPDFYRAGAEALIAAGRGDEAAGYLAQAISLARKLGMRSTLWRYLSAAAALAGERGDHETATALRAEAAAEIDFLAERIWPADLLASFLAQPEVAQTKSAARG